MTVLKGAAASAIYVRANSQEMDPEVMQRHIGLYVYRRECLMRLTGLAPTVRDYVGIPVNHVMVVNFKGFPRVVNAVGGTRVGPARRRVFDLPVGHDDNGTGRCGGRAGRPRPPVASPFRRASPCPRRRRSRRRSGAGGRRGRSPGSAPPATGAFRR